MTRTARWFSVALVVVIAGAAGFGGWLFARGSVPALPEISVYSHNQLIRVGPYKYCNVVDFNDCQNPQTQGKLVVNKRDAVQLSVPPEIARAPWRLLRVYDELRDSTERVFRPDTQQAFTIPTVDPNRGRLRGIVVQLMTVVEDQAGELHGLPHAEWSVEILWPQSAH